MRTIPKILALVLTGLTLTTLPACIDAPEPETWVAIYEAPQEGPQEPAYYPCAYCPVATSETIEALVDWCVAPEGEQAAGPLWCPDRVWTACPHTLDDPSCEDLQTILNGQYIYCCDPQ